jgi:hypothetical protein
VNQSLTRCLPALAAALALSAAPAQAQVEMDGAGADYTKETYPVRSLVDQPLTLPGGMLEIGVPVVIDISDGDTGLPDWSLPLYLDYGLTDGIQIGVFHSTGLCLAGEENGCADVYDDIGGRVRLGVWRSDPAAQLSLDAGVLAQNLTDGDSLNDDGGISTSGFVGLNYKRTMGMFALQIGAQLSSAFNDRDLLPFTEVLSASALGQLQFFEGLAAYGLVGVDAPLNENEIPGFETGVNVPVAIGAELAPFRSAAFGAEVRFPNLIGEDATADLRALTLYARVFL